MTEIKKQTRRGVSNQTKATSQLKFHEKDAAQNGLFIGKLVDVEVKWTTPENGVFAGLKAPNLTFHFTSNHTDSAELRHVYHTLFAVESTVDTANPKAKSAWRVNNVFNHIKHILDTFYLKGRDLTLEEEDALSLNFIDFNEETNEFIVVDPQEVLNGYGELFTNVANMLNGRFNIKEDETPKPCYKDANGNPIIIWLKLLRAIKGNNGWVNVNKNEELSIPNIVGTGYMERFKPNANPLIIRLDLVKESITPKAPAKQPTLGVNSMIGGFATPVMGGETPSMMGGFSAPNPFDQVSENIF